MILWFALLVLLPLLSFRQNFRGHVIQASGSLWVSTFIFSSAESPGTPSTPFPMPTNGSNQDTFPGEDWIPPAICPITQSYCSLNGSNETMEGATINGLSDQCLLWDDTCTGNTTLAISEFTLSTGWRLFENSCFVDPTDGNCSANSPPSRLTEFEKIKSWMRSRQCITGTSLFETPLGDPPFPLKNSTNSTTNPGSCCGTCYLDAGDVDVYYWPHSDANTSCLTIIGDSVKPLDYSATTTTYPTLTETYWGCTAKYPIPTIRHTDGGGVPVSSFLTIESIITMARIATHGSLNFKQSLLNPWPPPACVTKSSAQSSVHAIPASIRARGHSLIIPSIITQNRGHPVSTVVSGGFTL